MMKSPFFLLLGLLGLFACQDQPPLEADLILAGGAIYDGSTNEPFQGDVVIRGDSIIFAGPTKENNWTASKIIDATGYIIAPGFIDPHTHADRILSDSSSRANLNYLHQGVTTVFIGSDGRGPIQLAQKMELFRQQGIGTNVGIYMGHGSIRRLVMGTDDRRPTAAEMEQMKEILEKGMDLGALGLSAGLYYSPGSFAETEEVIELAKVAAAKGGVYDVHMRDESTYNIGLLNAVRETVEIAEKANIHANIAHIKAMR